MSKTADARRSRVLDDLVRDRVVEAVELARRYGVSEVTIRRDLDRLADEGLLRRVRGGAALTEDGSLFRPYSTRENIHRAEKERIGRAAAELIGPGQRVMFESGTTLVQVARHASLRIPEIAPLTVITTSLPISIELGRHRGVHLILLGGVYLPVTMSVIGPQAMRELDSVHADLMFVGGEGLALAEGLTVSNMLEAEVVAKMLSRADKAIAVLDSTKFGRVGLTSIVPVSGLHAIVTDTGAPEGFVRTLREGGTKVIQA
jgi:DeoR/GlpR family transcriptional regulator of sugar metabolism